MRRLIETGHSDDINEDRIQVFVSTGAGNTPHPEIHVHMVDPVEGTEIRAYFFRDELLAALLDPDDLPAILGKTGATA